MPFLMLSKIVVGQLSMVDDSAEGGVLDSQFLLAAPDDAEEPIDLQHFGFGEFFLGNIPVGVEGLGHGVEFQIGTNENDAGTIMTDQSTAVGAPLPMGEGGAKRP